MKKRGFSLIKIVISLVLAALIFSSAVPLIFNTIAANRAARLKTVAYQAANKSIEELKNSEFSTIESHPLIISGIPGASGHVIVNKNEPDLAEVKSEINWTFKNKAEKVEISTYIYNKEL